MRPVLILLLLAPLALHAQSPGTCDLGKAQAWLDANDVRAAVFNTGTLFFGDSLRSGLGYLVPKNSGLSPVYAASLWLGGTVDGEVRVAGSRYTRHEFWPGPLNEGATLPNPADCSAYDRIFVVSRDDVQHYLETGEATDDLRDWPVAWGAPVLDGDGIEGNYDLDGGDQPALYGDQTAWWVMNDVGNAHEETGSDPLGIEVQVSAFAVDGGVLPLQQATYYRYRIINRSSRTIDNTYASLFSDFDLGDVSDDYFGSDTTLSMGIVYNADPLDYSYGIPPAHGYQIVQGPVGLPNGRDDDHDGSVDEAEERLGMTALTTWCSCVQSGTTDPRTRHDYYNHMQGRWKDGVPITEGGFGYATSGPVTTFMFSGDPVEGQCWSMGDDCRGGAVSPSDWRFVVHTGPFRLEPGEETEIVFGLPFAQGRDHLDSVAELRSAAESVQTAWDTGFLAPSRVEGQRPPPALPLAIEITRPAPNPFTDRLMLTYTLPEALTVRVAVLDVLGREVAILASGEQSAGPHTVEVNTVPWTIGVYVFTFEALGSQKSFVVVKPR